MLLRGATLIHLDPPRVERADVRVEGGCVAQVAAGLVANPGEAVHDFTGRWLMPGLVCAHTHLYSALACGMPLPLEAPTSFADMLAKVWWKLDVALDLESVEVSALVGGVGALKAGVTTLVDHHASPNAIVGSLEAIDGALGTLGLRRILCYEVSDRGGPERAIAGLKAHEALLAQAGEGERAVMVGAHANFTLSDDTLRAVGALARSAGVGVHIHVAEARDDATLTGEDLVERMARLGALTEGSILAHCVHLRSDALRRIADAGAWITHQPRSNQNNGVGYAPVGDFPPTTALGTDGIGADMFAELQAGWFRAQEASVPWTPDRWLFSLTSGARMASHKLGVDLGHIRPGAAADLVVLNPPPGPPIRDESVAATMIFRLSAAAVQDVMMGGVFRVRDRCLVDMDEREINQRAMSAAQEIWKRMN
jgi:cytosine/adenosine deaminase-related metal-dependent hydrolase